MQKYPLNFMMKVDKAFFDAIDGWRRQQVDLPSRAEAIRRLVRQALSSEETNRQLPDR